MKIAFIVGAFPALSETFILNQITGLIDLGHEVDIYSRMTPRQGKIHPDVEKYNLYARTYYLNDVPKNKIKRILKAIKLFAINFHKSPLTIFKSLNIFKYGREALSLYLFYHAVAFLRKQYDIIHCHFGPNGNFGILMREVGAIEGKVITSFHGYDVNVINQNDYYTQLFKYRDLFTTNTEFTKKRVLGLGGDFKKIRILPVGLYLDKFPYRERVIRTGEVIRILTVARLVEKKGLEYSIRAVAKVVNKQSKCKIEYKIAGEGFLKNELKTLISELGMEDKIELLGWCDQDEVRKLFGESHIFILSSVTAENGDREGQGLVLQEAQAVGMPVISTLHNGIPEGVQDGKSGFLVPERDVDALAEKLEYLILHPEIWPKMGRAGRKYVEEHYDIKKLNQRLVKIYEELLSGTSECGSV
ncbi:MAG: glycosyltransferase [Deltaproteobacteria bacterium]|nr:glycosyltransferase [Deltaproteobacteria bacterium]